MTKPPPPGPEESLTASLITRPVKTSPTRLQPQNRQTPWGLRLLKGVGLTLLLSGAGTIVGISLWTSALFILQPNPPRWLARYLPNQSQLWGESPIQTLAEIETDLEPRQVYPGELINLAAVNRNNQLSGLRLLPILATRSPCSRDCTAIVELRLYGLHHREGSTEYLQLLHQLKVQGLTEGEVLDSLALGNTGTRGSTYRLPLTTLKPLDEAGLPGGWLTLTGRWRTQGSPVLHGQVLYINPQTRQLSSLLNWQSPPGRLPSWHNLDRKGLPELLVNQSYGLEPRFGLYQVSNVISANFGTRLQEISLSPVSLPSGASKAVYNNALFLAQRGLWSDAEKQLQTVKQQSAERWSLALEQQLQLISLHARFSQAQANRDWSQPSQKLLALLLDGQWAPALEVVSDSQTGYQRAVMPLLERDVSRLWQRLTASLKVNPHQKEARLWGALMLMSKEDEQAAIQWLSQNKQTALRGEFEAIAQKVSPAEAPAAAITVATPSGTDESPSSQASTVAPTAPLSSLFGVASPLSSVNVSAWRKIPGITELTLGANQQWYIITLKAGYRRQWQWQLGTPSDPSVPAIARFLAALGLSPDGTMQLVDPAARQVVSTVRVQGVQWRSDTVTLLASGPVSSLPDLLIATMPGQWVAAADGGGPSLGQLLQQQPEISDRLLPLLQNHIGIDLANLFAPTEQQTALLSTLATAQWINFTDDANAEILLTLQPELASYLDQFPVRTTPINLIVSLQGELLYSNLWAGSAQSLIGWLQLPDGNPALVAMAGDRPALLTWSPQNRRFQ